MALVGAEGPDVTTPITAAARPASGSLGFLMYSKPSSRGLCAQGWEGTMFGSWIHRCGHRGMCLHVIHRCTHIHSCIQAYTMQVPRVAGESLERWWHPDKWAYMMPVPRSRYEGGSHAKSGYRRAAVPRAKQGGTAIPGRRRGCCHSHPRPTPPQARTPGKCHPRP